MAGFSLEPVIVCYLFASFLILWAMDFFIKTKYTLQINDQHIVGYFNLNCIKNFVYFSHIKSDAKARHFLKIMGGTWVPVFKPKFFIINPVQKISVNSLHNFSEGFFL